MKKSERHPRQVVLDLVLQWTIGITGKGGTATLTPIDKRLLIFARNHLAVAVPVHFDGPTNDGENGEPARWVFYRIAPGVWKLSQSVLDDLIHAYVTVVGVPEPPPWETP